MNSICLLAVIACGHAPVPALPVDSHRILWIEAESYAAQSGSQAPSYAMPSASGGACVDNGWGGNRDDFLRYDVALPVDFATLFVTLCYARESAGASAVRVTLDGKSDESAVVKLPATGNWGFVAAGWKYVTVQMPACIAGTHTLEIRSLADQNNVNFDGFYVSATQVDTDGAHRAWPAGVETTAPLGPGLFALPCKTPVALPYSRRKAIVTSDGELRSLLGTPAPRGMGGNVAGPSLQVLLSGQEPGATIEQTMNNSPVPTVVTRRTWPEVEVEQSIFAAAPEESGFFVHVTVTNKGTRRNTFELLSIVRNAGDVQVADAQRVVASGQTLLHALPLDGIRVIARNRVLPGPLGDAPSLCHQLTLDPGATVSFDLQFLGDGSSPDEARAAAVKVWQDAIAPATRMQLPDARLQHAFDAALRQMLTLIEARPDHARVLKGLEHYYGANPYDTFQVSRALDAVGLQRDAEELLRHQQCHLKDDGIFEMWETGDLQQAGAQQWIVQGLAATALWKHYELWGDEVWLREITPTLIRAARATLRARQAHTGSHRQGSLEITGWLPPLGGDGGLGVGYHWSQNAGPLNGLRIAAEAARRLQLPEADELRAGWLDFQRAFDTVRAEAAAADPDRLLAAFPGATGADRLRPLWGVVMSVTAFDAIAPDDPAAVNTLRVLQQDLYGGLHRNLGYSQGVWPYLSAEVALWHLRLGEAEEAWRILRAIVDRASSTVCWYEEIDHAPPRGYGDPADVWAAAELVYLVCALLADERPRTADR